MRCPNDGGYFENPRHAMRFLGVVVDERFVVTLRLRCVYCGTVVETRLKEGGA
jgi:hypothetical protein